MPEAGTPEPQWRLDANELLLEFPFPSVHLEAVSGRFDGMHGPGVAPEVTPEVRLLRAMASAAVPTLPRRALQEAPGLSDDEHFRKTVLLPALAGGLIEMTHPDKPTSRMQQYRLTEAGRTRLQALTTRGKPP